MRAWELYQSCRTLDIKIYEKPTGKRDGSKLLSTVPWPTGFSQLPGAGGLDDQDYVTMKYFFGFLAGEREGASKLISKRGR